MKARNAPWIVIALVAFTVAARAAVETASTY